MALRSRPKYREPDEERALLADGLVPRVALPSRPKYRELDEERERFRAKGLMLSLEEAPDDARPVLRALEGAPWRLEPKRVQVPGWPDDARGLARFENEVLLRDALGADDAEREPENAFDLQLSWGAPDDLGTEEPPREPK